MANNPLQRTGLLKVSDIMKEKEWLGTENKSLTNLVEANDRLAPYVVINSLNPLNIRTRITTKPYRISSWYDYNHALTEGSTELNGTIVGGTMKSMTKGSSESGSGLGLYNNHQKTLTNHLLNCTAGNSTAKSAGNDTFLDVWTRFEVTNAVTGGRGNYYVDNSRAYLQIDLSSISSMRVISKAEILLTCVSNTYTPCKVVLVKYEGGTNFIDYSFYPYSQIISEPILFASGEQTFTLNSAGIAYLNEKFASGDKYLRVGLITYDYDFLQLPFIGDNLVQGADSAFTSQGHWQLNNSQTASFTTETVGTRTLPVMKVFPGTSERITMILAGSNYSPAISGGTYYFLNWYYRFGQYPVNFDKVDFGAYTRSYISGNELPVSFLHPDNPTGMSPEWQNGYAFTSVAAGGDLLINVGGYSYPEDSVNEFAVAGLSIVNPIFLKMLGGKYNTPKLKYYYDGYPGAVSTGSVSGVTANQATLTATVTTDGRTNIIASGLCWNTTGSPTTANSKTTDGATSVTGFSSTATGLTSGVTYYIRPYVTTEAGTYYGAQTSFSTNGLPTAQISISISIAATSATFRGAVSSDGGLTITDFGFVFKPGSLPSITDNKNSVTYLGVNTTHSKSITGLTPNTTYYVKAFATNSLGTVLCVSYDQFTTLTALPTVTWNSCSNYDPQATYVDLTGTASADGGSSITDRGFVYKANANPSITDNKVSANSPTGTGTFTKTISGLSPNTTYYYGVYATNANGTQLSPTFGSFVTPIGLPICNYTDAATSITNNTATAGGYISYDNTLAITQRGICWATTPNPTTANSKATSGTGTGSFSVGITGLSSGSTYYVRLYATNSAGTAYASQISFTTLSITVPTVSSTTSVTSITMTSAASGGNVSSDGGATVTERGICWNTAGTPTISNSKQTASGTTGTFSANLPGLTAGTTYYVRAYATNSQGTAYAAQVSFATTSILIPTVTTTSPINSYGSSWAWVYGNVSADNGGTVTAKGICFNTSGNPTTSNNTVSGGSGTGSISSYLSGLAGSTWYHCRAYAINSAGTAYGAEVDVYTLASVTIPTVSTTSPATSIGASSATVAGNVSSDGGASVTEKGVCYNTYGSPTTDNSKVTSGTGTGSISSVITGLTAGTYYYAKAYATNSQGTAYGSQIGFTTTSGGVPSISTGYADPMYSGHAISPEKNMIAIMGSEVTSDGGATITERGICYMINSGTPTTANNKITDPGTTGLFDIEINNFIRDSQTMSYRAYAINSYGTSYGVSRTMTANDAWWYQ
ncbi:MAG: hypothetical protein WC699_15825 [Bacteroidales bacterium]|jgi:hypothetical protein